MTKTIRPYGAWSSPITPLMLSLRTRLGDVAWDTDGETLVWLENRSDRGVLVARAGRQASRDLTDAQSVRGGVGYGGGEFAVQNGQVYFAERNGRLYTRPLGFGQPRALTPPFGALASPAPSPDGRWIAYVFSDGREDVLGLVDAAGQEWPLKLARGADFYMQPAWHPSGRRLAWVEWDHPNMPWDGARLALAELEGEPPRVASHRVLAGDARTPVSQPRFSPDGRYLAWLVGSGEWEDLVLLDLESALPGAQQRVLVHGQGFMLSEPAWVQGGRSYGWAHDSQSIVFTRYESGFASLWRVRLAGGPPEPIPAGAYTYFQQLAVSPLRDELAVVAASASQPARLIRIAPGGSVVEARSEPESVAPEFFPRAEPLTWQAGDGALVHGMFYAPANPNFESPGKPPLLVHVHGGPTSAHVATYQAEIAYFTSRGYAWLDVNYRGSTGFGRAYQDALNGRWGDVDVEDTASGARALAARGLVDGDHMAILGGSAGGYTVLNALIRHPGLFRAGICQYGVSNLFTLATDTHKFEAHYNDSLVGALPEAAQKYRDWSPIFHVDAIRDPMAVFQGADDKVVPPDQSETLVEALRRRGIPHIYRLYEGEGHGFRKSSTIADFLEQTERFLAQYCLFA